MFGAGTGDRGATLTRSGAVVGPDAGGVGASALTVCTSHGSRAGHHTLSCAAACCSDEWNDRPAATGVRVIMATHRARYRE